MKSEGFKLATERLQPIENLAMNRRIFICLLVKIFEKRIGFKSVRGFLRNSSLSIISIGIGDKFIRSVL